MPGRFIISVCINFLIEKKKTLHWFILRDALKNLILYFVKVFKNICPILFNTKNWKRD